MNEPPLLPISAHRMAAELRRAREQDAAERELEGKRRRVFWYCVALSSYALPFFRWLAWHVNTSNAFDA